MGTFVIIFEPPRHNSHVVGKAELGNSSLSTFAICTGNPDLDIHWEPLTQVRPRQLIP